MDKKRILLLLIGVMLLLTSCNPLDLLSIGTTFTPIYCNDYEFTCCNQQKVSTYDYQWGTRQGDIFTCSADADRCHVDIDILSQYSYNNLMMSNGISSCTYKTGFLVDDGYSCTGSTNLGHSFHGDIGPGKVIYLSTPEWLSSPFNSIHIETYKSRLDFCGRAGCTVGVPVSGADKCSFQTDKSIYGTGGQIIKTPSQTSTSYPVPSATCVLAYQSGDRHICGNKEEQCSQNTDCTGHTYGTKECTGRTLQEYGCTKFTDPNTQTNYDLGWTQGKDLSYTASRCEIVSAQQVQCCGDTDCGSNAFCDKTSWTCKQQVQCTQDSDCGVSTQCDWTTKELKTPACKSGQCAYNTQAVGCCLDVNCPTGYFCGADHQCKQSSIPKLTCPFSCCIQESEYFDKPCVSGETCCGDNTCKQDCAALPPIVDDKWCEEQGGTVVETAKECNWLQSVFGCKGEVTKVCRIPHTPYLAVVLMLVGVVLIFAGLFKDQTPGIIIGFVIFVLNLIWFILAIKGIL